MSATVLEGPAARQLFVNREELISEFLKRIHADPAVDNILFVRREGGIGNLLLLSCLQDRYSLRLRIPAGGFMDPWTDLASRDAAGIVRAVERMDCDTVPAALIDFSEPGPGQNPRTL